MKSALAASALLLAGCAAAAPLATAIVQAVAECLAGVVYVNAMAPGHPAVFGTWPFVSDLRTGAMSGRTVWRISCPGCAPCPPRSIPRYYGE